MRTARDAQVVHSHNYCALQQFHRNFDLAVSQTMHPEVFGGIRSESEGITSGEKKSFLLYKDRETVADDPGGDPECRKAVGI